jgi:chemotaxis protein MotB
MTALGTRIDQTGAAVELRGGQVTVAFSDELLAFEPGEAVLSETSARPLRTVARFLSEHPSLDVWVEGHTDAAAFSSGNWLLGAQRALAVVEALTRYGVPARRIALTSHGEHRPVAPNTTADGRRKNRRVEIVLAESGSR